MAKKPESKLQIKIRKGLKEYFGGFWIKIHGGPYQQKGMPDLLGCLLGLYITVEVKLPDEKRSKLMLHQRQILRTIRRAGGCAITARSLEEAITKIEEYLSEVTKSKIIWLPKESSEVCLRKRKSSIIHGAGNWEDDYDALCNSKKLQKKKV